MGVFASTGWVFGPIDTRLDPRSSNFSMPLGTRGGGWFEREDHGVNWTGFSIPLWKAFAIFGLSFLLMSGAARVRIRSLFAREKKPGFCEKCGYDLRATPNRCPECGTIPSAGESPLNHVN